MRALMCAVIAIAVGALCQTLAIMYVGPVPWLYESIADFLPRNWIAPILTCSILSAPLGVVVTLALASGLRRTADDCR